MRRSIGAILLLAAIGAGWIGQSALAASPSSGNVSRVKRTLSYKAGPFTTSFPDPVPATDCSPSGVAASQCDFYKLKVTDLKDGAKINVKIVGSNPCSADCLAQPVEGNDFDLYIYAPNGSYVGGSQTPSGVEQGQFIFKSKYRNKAYTIGVRPWAVLPGATFKGSIKVLSGF